MIETFYTDAALYSSGPPTPAPPALSDPARSSAGDGSKGVPGRDGGGGGDASAPSPAPQPRTLASPLASKQAVSLPCTTNAQRPRATMPNPRRSSARCSGPPATEFLLPTHVRWLQHRGPVKHATFGEGQALEVTLSGQDQIMTVRSKTTGKRRLISRMAELERL